MRPHLPVACTALAFSLFLTSPAGGQSAPLPAWADSAIVMAPGPQYARGGLFRTFAGNHHRDMWVTPIRVPVLDLHRFAGGLTALEAHTGSQTKSLRFQGADGKQYQFRSVDKDPTALLAPELQTSTMAKLQRDGVSSSHPAASLVASALLKAAGVLHVPQVYVVMPDDPALGEYRGDFKGMLGMIEERPSKEAETFAGARRIISPTKLFEKIDASPENRVDARAFLAARLMDILMGDRDRHRDQWRWASFGKGKPVLWQPISRDHDEAFVNLDGPILAVTRLYYPPLVAFRDDYPRLYQLNWHAREVDRRFLVELDRATWDSVASALQTTLTDSVIVGAADHMPPEMVAVDSGRLARTLEHRRDSLVSEARKYYAFLSHEVEVRATDAPEITVVDRTDPDHLELTIRERGRAEPYFRRVFDGRETHEIRLKMWGGDDSVVVRGGEGPIALKVVGGGGDDVFADSSRGDHLKFYDDSGQTTLTSLRGGKVNGKRWDEWIGSDTNRYPPREWGTWWRPISWLAANGDLGLFIGGGFLRTEYGFRRTPYASHIEARVGYATGAQAFKADLHGEFHPENANPFWRLHARASGIEVLRYYGLGNETPASDNSDFNRLEQQEYTLEPSLVVPLGKSARVSAGLSAEYFHTGQNDGRFIQTIQDTLYGANDFGQTGGHLALDVDTRDREANPRYGAYLRAGAGLFPPVWDVTDTYGSVEAEGAAFLSAKMIASPTLALRAGGRKVFGDRFPFQQSAFIGGSSSVRGFFSNRFAGDASVFGNVELRLQVATTYRILPGFWGVFVNGDAGRVYLDGDSPGGWHTSGGGGVWVALLDRSNTVTFGVAASEERTTFYLGTGFGF
jgi:hypothetical protein